MIDNILALLFLLVPVVIAIKYMHKRKKQSKCIGCPLACQCHKNKP